MVQYLKKMVSPRALSKVPCLTLETYRASKAKKQLMAKRLSKYFRICMKLASVSTLVRHTIIAHLTSYPDTVLLDINMWVATFDVHSASGSNIHFDTRPNMDGFEASTAMRKIESQSSTRKRSQIIAITALSGEEHRERGLKE